MSTTMYQQPESNAGEVCGAYGCEERAVVWVRYQAQDVGRSHVRWFTDESDMCQEHMDDLERDVDRREAYIMEQIDYRVGSSYHELVST